MGTSLMLIFIPLGMAIIIFTIYSKTRKSNATQKSIYQSFLKEERESNFARKKDPEPEDYLTVDIHRLPIREYPDDPTYTRVAARQKNILEIARLPMICDVRGMTNRELKLKYGTANLDTIITYEENYNRFIHNLLEWATALTGLGNNIDAAVVLEAAIDHRCDRSQAYTMLADITTDRDKLGALQKKAQAALLGSALGRTLAHIDQRLDAIK